MELQSLTKYINKYIKENADGNATAVFVPAFFEDKIVINNGHQTFTITEGFNYYFVNVSQKSGEVELKLAVKKSKNSNREDLSITTFINAFLYVNNYPYWVWVSDSEFDKNQFTFATKKEAEVFFNKIAKSKKISRDLVDENNESGYEAEYGDVLSVSYGKNDETFDEKEFD